uniref:G_PROTEIN_RECEP_F1_2 domain-containing protein n=1 Tax=Caenorhabditis tropicalis TaxID=1561998 RepID=A0A1I7UWR6_9PELO
MKGVYNEFAFVLLFEFLFRHLNVLISIFGIIFNILHFSVLIRKPLRTEPVFIMMLVICICDLLQLFIMIPDDIIYINKTRDPNGCFGVNTYSEAIYVIAADILARFASFVSTWMAVLMVAFKAASIQFVSSSWSTTLLEPSTTYKASTIVIVISVIYISIYDVIYIKETSDPNGCIGMSTYSRAIHEIAADILSRFASFVSTWMAVLMAVFKAVSIQVN